jgi:hypothetical protein
MATFDTFSICHVYREQNSAADAISKEGTQLDYMQWMVYEHRNGEVLQLNLTPFSADRRPST